MFGSVFEERLCIVCASEISQEDRIDKIYCSPLCASKARNKKYRQNNPEKIRAKRQQENSQYPARIHSRVKCRAIRQGIPFDLDRDDIVIPEVCPVLGIALDPAIGKGSGFHDNSPSLDRINPELGYTKGNVRVISARANLLKSNASVEELEKVLEDLRRL